MRNARAYCAKCRWHGFAADETLIVAMAREHQLAVGHIVRIHVPEGWFGWGSFDMYPIPEITAREEMMAERLAGDWNRPFRYNGD